MLRLAQPHEPPVVLPPAAPLIRPATRQAAPGRPFSQKQTSGEDAAGVGEGEAGGVVESLVGHGDALFRLAFLEWRTLRGPARKVIQN